VGVAVARVSETTCDAMSRNPSDSSCLRGAQLNNPEQSKFAGKIKAVEFPIPNELAKYPMKRC